MNATLPEHAPEAPETPGAIPPGGRPRVSRLFRFQWEPTQQAHVLLYPEGMVKLNQSAGEILKRCDGSRSVEEIVADLEECFHTFGLAPDVHAFLSVAEAQNWISWDAA